MLKTRREDDSFLFFLSLIRVGMRVRKIEILMVRCGGNVLKHLRCFICAKEIPPSRTNIYNKRQQLLRNNLSIENTVNVYNLFFFNLRVFAAKEGPCAWHYTEEATT